MNGKSQTVVLFRTASTNNILTEISSFVDRKTKSKRIISIQSNQKISSIMSSMSSAKREMLILYKKKSFCFGRAHARSHRHTHSRTHMYTVTALRSTRHFCVRQLSKFNLNCCFLRFALRINWFDVVFDSSHRISSVCFVFFFFFVAKIDLIRHSICQSQCSLFINLLDAQI